MPPGPQEVGHPVAALSEVTDRSSRFPCGHTPLTCPKVQLLAVGDWRRERSAMVTVRKHESNEDLAVSTYSGGINIVKAGFAFSDTGAGDMICIASCVVQNSSGSSSNFAQARMFSFTGASAAHTNDLAYDASTDVWRGAGGMDVIDAGQGLVEVYLGGG